MKVRASIRSLAKQPGSVVVRPVAAGTSVYGVPARAKDGPTPGSPPAGGAH